MDNWLLEAQGEAGFDGTLAEAIDNFEQVG
jgi:hypothetical protein